MMTRFTASLQGWMMMNKIALQSSDFFGSMRFAWQDQWKSRQQDGTEQSDGDK